MKLLQFYEVPPACPVYFTYMDENINTTGKRIRYLRETINQWNGTKFRDELRARTGEAIKPSTLTNHEKDTSMPAYPTLVNYAKVLGTTTDFLLLVTDDPGPTKKTDRTIVIEAKGEEERRILEEITSGLEEMQTGDLRFVLDLVRRISPLASRVKDEMDDVEIQPLIAKILETIEKVGGTKLRERAVADLESSLPPSSPLTATWRRLRPKRTDKPLQGHN